MALKQEPFRKYNEEKVADTFTVKFNKDERAKFNGFKKGIQQKKDSTAIKQLAWIGAEVVLDEKNKALVEVILNNYRKNKRLGIVDFD